MYTFLLVTSAEEVEVLVNIVEPREDRNDDVYSIELDFSSSKGDNMCFSVGIPPTSTMNVTDKSFYVTTKSNTSDHEISNFSKVTDYITKVLNRCSSIPMLVHLMMEKGIINEISSMNKSNETKLSTSIEINMESIKEEDESIFHPKKKRKI